MPQEKSSAPKAAAILRIFSFVAVLFHGRQGCHLRGGAVSRQREVGSLILLKGAIKHRHSGRPHGRIIPPGRPRQRCLLIARPERNEPDEGISARLAEMRLVSFIGRGVRRWRVTSKSRRRCRDLRAGMTPSPAAAPWYGRTSDGCCRS